MDDLISRQAAIDEIEYELEMINSALDSTTLDFNTRERLRQRRGEAREILNSIQQLPSVQPYTEAEIQKMQELEQAELQKAYECGRASAQPEIIYCKDCKYFERDIQRSWGTYNGCGVWTDDGNEIEVNQDDFCSYAERREE